MVPARRGRTRDSLLLLINAGGGLGLTAEMSVQVLDRVLERRQDALLFIVGGYHNTEADLGGFDRARVRYGQEGAIAFLGLLVLARLALGQPTVVPAGQLAGHDLAVGSGGFVRLFGGEDSARLGRNEVKNCVDLVCLLVSICGNPELHGIALTV